MEANKSLSEKLVARSGTTEKKLSKEDESLQRKGHKNRKKNKMRRLSVRGNNKAIQRTAKVNASKRRTRKQHNKEYMRKTTAHV